MPSSKIIVDFWLDLASVDCYLALNSFRQALARLPERDRFTLALHPFLTQHAGTTTVGEEVATRAPGPDRLDRESAEAAARAAGITLDWDAELPTQTTEAHRLLLWAQQSKAEVSGGSAESLSVRLAEALLRSAFELGANLASPELLIGVAQDLNLPGAEVARALTDEVLAAEVEEANQLALYLGVQQTPVLLFDDTFVVQGYQTPEAFTNILRTVVQQAEAAEGNTND